VTKHNLSTNYLQVEILYEHLQGMPLPRLIRQCWTGKVLETYTYRYLNQVPLRDGDDASWSTGANSPSLVLMAKLPTKMLLRPIT